MSASNPLVSVIIPCFNASAWVGDAVKSALSQTWRNLEVIVVDDGSIDDSISRLREITDPRLTLVSQDNAGACVARNHGFVLAKGDYIQFLDADDQLHPEKIESQLSVALSTTHPDRTLVSGRWARFTTDPAEAWCAPSRLYANLDPVKFQVIALLDDDMMQTGAWLVSRTLCELAGPWDERLTSGDDGEFFARVMFESGKIDYCEKSVIYFRSGNPGSLSWKKTQVSFRSIAATLESIERLVLKVDVSHEVRLALATGWRRLAWSAWPVCSEVSSRALLRSQALGGSKAPLVSGGPIIHRSAEVLGWRPARFVQWLVHSAGYQNWKTSRVEQA